MSEITRDQVLQQLSKVRGPDLKNDLVAAGLVSEIAITGSDVSFSLTINPAEAERLEPMRQAAAQSVEALDGVGKVLVTLTAELQNGASNGAAPAPSGAGMPHVHKSSGKKPGAGAGAPPPPMAGPQGAPGAGKMAGIPGIKHIIAVASGKGGVGKSTTACNVALGLLASGAKVGILDADIYGPSMPRLLGITGQPQPGEGGKLEAMQGYGLKVMSMGFLVEEDTPMIWRGPMVMSALTQMMRDVNWGELDVLVVDMPPGTGDAQLTMAQQVPLAGAIIVSTPQDLALIDARKGLNMFRKVDVPVLGIVENMSYFACPKCGEHSAIFGNGGARAEAEKIGVTFLGEVPLHIEVRERSDAGLPIVATKPDSEHAEIYRQIAENTYAQLQDGTPGRKAAPAIVVE
ncbi:MAG: iron-sulfur cluster carrier protein ApbC [Alphaproteobacteria bacterium]|nr:iron-sulfur cluster carrier protein ApbC [Alphaproteobacteria bacterium]